MKQNTAYGASLMTRPIRVIETSNRPSMPRRRISMPGVVLLTTMPTPNISAKNISVRIGEAGIGGGGDAVLGAEVLGEALGALQPGGGGAGADGLHAQAGEAGGPPARNR